MGGSKVTFDMFLERAKAKHGNKYNYSKVNWINTRIKIEIVCPEHGSFWQKPYKHMEGQGCPSCCESASISQETFIKRAKKIHNDRYDYSRVNYVNMRTPVEIVCPEHGSFWQLPSKHVKSGKSQAQGCPKCRYDRQRKTLKLRYGIDNPMKKKEFLERNWETKKENGTCSSSKPEEQMYDELVDVFGKMNVERNYNQDERYPFRCDFYIKSYDMFIELNATWFHGNHFFNDEDERDVEVLNLWKAKLKNGHVAYKGAIYTWTFNDVRKRKMAEANKLNYLVFWDNDLNDFYNWLEGFIETNRTIL